MQSPYIIYSESKIIWQNSRIYRENECNYICQNGVFTSRDMEMLLFLINHKAATVSQIARACYPGKTKIRERLRRLACLRVIDGFTWTDGNKHTKPMVYFPGPGGLSLLQHFPEGKYCPEKRVTVQSGWYKRSMLEVAPLLLANEFIIRTGPVIRNYIAEPVFKFGRAAIIPTSFFIARKTRLIMRVFRGAGQLQQFMKEINLYEQLIEGAAGLGRDGQKPVLLLVCESEHQALKLAYFMQTHSTLSRFRLSTDSDIMFKPPHLAFSALEEERLVVKAANIFKAPFDNVPPVSII